MKIALIVVAGSFFFSLSCTAQQKNPFINKTWFCFKSVVNGLVHGITVGTQQFQDYYDFRDDGSGEKNIVRYYGYDISDRYLGVWHFDHGKLSMTPKGKNNPAVIYDVIAEKDDNFLILINTKGDKYYLCDGVDAVNK